MTISISHAALRDRKQHLFAEVRQSRICQKTAVELEQEPPLLRRLVPSIPWQASANAQPVSASHSPDVARPRALSLQLADTAHRGRHRDGAVQETARRRGCRHTTYNQNRQDWRQSSASQPQAYSQGRRYLRRPKHAWWVPIGVHFYAVWRQPEAHLRHDPARSQATV